MSGENNKSIPDVRNYPRKGPDGIVIFDEDLAYIDEQLNARRGWWMDLLTGRDLLAGTSIEDAIGAVEKVEALTCK